METPTTPTRLQELIDRKARIKLEQKVKELWSNMRGERCLANIRIEIRNPYPNAKEQFQKIYLSELLQFLDEYIINENIDEYAQRETEAFMESVANLKDKVDLLMSENSYE